MVNDSGVTVYNKTKRFSISDYNGSELSFSIPDSDIQGGNTQCGRIYLTVYNDGFSLNYDTSTSDLPYAPVKVDLPTLPKTINYYGYSGTLYSSVKVTGITYEFVYGDTLKIFFEGEKTYDHQGNSQSDSCKIGWKLYDEDDYVIESGTFYSDSIRVGEKFKNNEVYIPEVLVAARSMNMGAQVLKPYLAAGSFTATGKVCIGTVQGDLHDIGKNLVKMMREGKGLEVIDLGTDVSPETFVQTAKEQDCSIICCSALLTTTMGVMKQVVEEAEKAGIRDKVKIMVGGAPVTQEFCDEIGADCYTADAASAADAAVAFCKG